MINVTFSVGTILISLRILSLLDTVFQGMTENKLNVVETKGPNETEFSLETQKTIMIFVHTKVESAKVQTAHTKVQNT